MSTNATQSQTESELTDDRAAQELLERLRIATLGEYDILGELGRGGMATVYLAHELSLDRKVAIKVMLPAMLTGPGMVERFKREARTAANLSHPNIIPIYTVREAEGLIFCVIKLVEGTPLDAVMRELSQLPIPMVQGILAQVGGALGYAHRHGVIHRDIKPGNILIDDEGWAVVTDFGIAKVVSSTGLTSTGMAIGTPTYMSPEQATADEVTGASDQYSLGVVAYEMLAGRPPFVGGSMVALMYSHNHDDPPSLKLFRHDVPDQLCDAVMRMLRKAPDERFPTMEDAVAAAGARPLMHDDPSRSQLIALAKTGLTHKIVSQAFTPRSPVPRPSRATLPARVARNPLLLGASAAGLVAAGFLLSKMMTGSPDAGSVPQPTAPQVAAESIATVPPPTPAPSTERPDSTPRTVTPPRQERRVEPPPVWSSTAASRSPAPSPTRDSVRPAATPPDSSRPAPLVQKAETTARANVPPIASPAVSESPVSRQPAASINTPVRTPAEEVTAIIQAYARALGASDLAAARRIYQMPNDQREGLERLWAAGGTIGPNWSVSDIAVAGDVATARVSGFNVFVSGRGQTPQRINVALRARLERRNNEWRLVALIN
jgi:serine/threonine protein kinase